MLLTMRMAVNSGISPEECTSASSIRHNISAQNSGTGCSDEEICPRLAGRQSSEKADPEKDKDLTPGEAASEKDKDARPDETASEKEAFFRELLLLLGDTSGSSSPSPALMGDGICAQKEVFLGLECILDGAGGADADAAECCPCA
jgi:hypothetical protein